MTITACAPLPGLGLVARRGDLVVVTDGRAEGPDPLLGALDEVAAGDGAALVLAAARAALAHPGRFSGACAGVTASGEVAVLVYGAAVAAISIDGAPEVEVKAGGAVLPVARTFAGSTVRARLLSGGQASPDDRLWLDGGIVYGRGLALTIASATGAAVPASPPGDAMTGLDRPQAEPPTSQQSCVGDREPRPPSPDFQPDPSPGSQPATGELTVDLTQADTLPPFDSPVLPSPGIPDSGERWPPAEQDHVPSVHQPEGPVFGFDPIFGPDDDAGQPDHEVPRYLKGQCPDSVTVGEPFRVLASVVRMTAGHEPLKSFRAGRGGQDILLVLHAPGLQVLTGQRQVLQVPFGADSEPVMFELRASKPGPCQLSISAWRGGTFLGDLTVETTASQLQHHGGGHRDFIAGIETTPVEGAVSLVARYDPVQNSYRFEFRDEDNPAEVTSTLMHQPGPLIEQLVFGLDRLARGKTGHSAAGTRDYLRQEGIGLWSELLPQQLREQFWERQGRIGQLTILADNDAVPWELLYPLDPGHDAGFLVEQFPVTRVVFGRRPPRSLSLSPAWFVLPEGSPQQAHEEVSALSALLAGPWRETMTGPPVISELPPLLELIGGGEFGLLHFACHNAFDAANGSAITLGKRQFSPTQLNSAAVERVLTQSAPTVFLNACRSAGVNPSCHQLDGWARKFLEAGAAAFIGSLWAVRDTTARDFASEVYGSLRSGTSLGEAVWQARLAAASEPGDPTWLAYAVYGDPRATTRWLAPW